MHNIFFGMNIITLLLFIILISVGIYDLYRYWYGKKTISQKVHAWTHSRWLDAGIMIGFVIIIWWLASPNVAVWVIIGCILGHFFWTNDV